MLFLLGIGMVFVIEGLALALAPNRMERLLEAYAAMSRDRRRLLGLAAMAFGVAIVWLARHFAP